MIITTITHQSNYNEAKITTHITHKKIAQRAIIENDNLSESNNITRQMTESQSKLNDLTEIAPEIQLRGN